MDRITGVDTARGVAILGMFTAHLGYAGAEFFTPTGWLTLSNGRSSALFALLAGVSIALMSGAVRPTGLRLATIRRRVVVRAVLLLGIGYALVALDTPIAVILPSYAVTFLLLVPVLGMSSRALVTIAAVVVVVVAPALEAWRSTVTEPTEFMNLIVTGYYPAFAWVAYMLVGVAVGRLALREKGIQLRVLGLGAALAALGYGAGALGVQLFPDLTSWITIAPHNDTPTEMTGNIGAGLGVLALCLLAARTATGRFVLTPIASTGSMALTVYCAQVVAFAIMRPVVGLQSTNGTLIAFTLVTLTACTLWVRFVGRGPLERLMRAASLAVAPSSAPVLPHAVPDGHGAGHGVWRRETPPRSQRQPTAK